MAAKDKKTLGKPESKSTSNISDIKSLIKFFYIKYVPSYGNSFFFTIGVYLLEIFAILAITGIVMSIFGPSWPVTTITGNFVLSVHLWAAEAFVTLMFLHLFVNFSTSMFKSKRLVWMLGSMMMFLVLLEFAFGVALPGDFVGQVNSRAGADLWNGMGLGFWINPLNHAAVLGWHIAIVPLLLLMLMFTHYMLVKRRGLSTPYRKDIPYSMVPTDHNAMYRRMAYIFVVILAFAFFLRAPFTPPMTTQSFASATPSGFAMTLLSEFNHSSGTATYLDTIDPYRFDTRNVYIDLPYWEYINTTHYPNELNAFYAENISEQNASIAESFAYFEANGTVAGAINSSNPLTSVIGTLTRISQGGLYGPILQSETAIGTNETYTLLFLSDSDAFVNKTTDNGLQVSQWGMLSLGNAWQHADLMFWLIPYNLMQIVMSRLPWWNDLENGAVALVAFVILMFLPYIPYLRDVPDRLGLYKLFWNRFTVPEMRKGKIKKRMAR
ncbi:MAG: cytochrome b N-terminal domain-containing protein [Candidatus Micrarchaeota archaeon]|nr:cytochrome b N-terminal domain-containing protein [Candidatus Micrarchaeota archaeon]